MAMTTALLATKCEVKYL